MKEQWLTFLGKCATAKQIPDDANETIKNAFKIMEIFKS